MFRRTLAVAGSLILCVAVGVGVASGQKSKGDPDKGKDVFNGQQCTMCHNVDSPDKKMGPSLQHLFQRKTLQNGKPVSDDNVLAQVNEGGNGMPPYNDTLTATDKENLLAYLHTL